MLLGFKKRFVEPILIGTKVHTMRRRRKTPPKIGETLHMYTGLRTGNCEKITSREILIGKQKVWISMVFKLEARSVEIFSLKICIDGKRIALVTRYGEDVNIENPGALDRFVKFDGFNDYMDFCTFWIEGYRKDIRQKGAYGQLCKTVESMDLYHWTDLKY